MSELILLKVIFIAGCAIAAMVTTLVTSSEHHETQETIRNQYAMPKVLGYGLAVLFALMALNELGHLMALVRGGAA